MQSCSTLRKVPLFPKFPKKGLLLKFISIHPMHTHPQHFTIFLAMQTPGSLKFNVGPTGVKSGFPVAVQHFMGNMHIFWNFWKNVVPGNILPYNHMCAGLHSVLLYFRRSQHSRCRSTVRGPPGDPPESSRGSHWVKNIFQAATPHFMQNVQFFEISGKTHFQQI